MIPKDDDIRLDCGIEPHGYYPHLRVPSVIDDSENPEYAEMRAADDQAWDAVLHPEDYV